MVKVVKEYSNRFSIIGGIEPNRLTLQEAREWLERQYGAGVSGFKLYPVHSHIKPNAYREEEGGLRHLGLLIL